MSGSGKPETTTTKRPQNTHKEIEMSKTTNSTVYTVANNCGGTAYAGRSLKKACEAATSHFGSGYIETAQGRRPVCDDYSNDGCYHIGEFGESWDDLNARIDE